MFGLPTWAYPQSGESCREYALRMASLGVDFLEAENLFNKLYGIATQEPEDKSLCPYRFTTAGID